MELDDFSEVVCGMARGALLRHDVVLRADAVEHIAHDEAQLGLELQRCHLGQVAVALPNVPAKLRCTRERCSFVIRL